MKNTQIHWQKQSSGQICYDQHHHLKPPASCQHSLYDFCACT